MEETVYTNSVNTNCVEIGSKAIKRLKKMAKGDSIEDDMMKEFIRAFEESGVDIGVYNGIFDFFEFGNPHNMFVVIDDIVYVRKLNVELLNPDYATEV